MLIGPLNLKLQWLLANQPHTDAVQLCEAYIPMNLYKHVLLD